MIELKEFKKLIGYENLYKLENEEVFDYLKKFIKSNIKYDLETVKEVINLYARLGKTIPIIVDKASLRDAIYEAFRDSLLLDLENKESHARLLKTVVAGAKYSPYAKEIYPNLKLGSKLVLESEPYNPYDKFAVKISYEGKSLGYIPRAYSYFISNLLVQNVDLKVKVYEKSE